jgi:hypothetical protein
VSSWQKVSRPNALLRSGPPELSFLLIFRARSTIRRAQVQRRETEAMANIQIDDILAGTPSVQCKTKVRARMCVSERPPRRV